MQSDYRDHPLFREAETLTRKWFRPGENHVASPDAARLQSRWAPCGWSRRHLRGALDVPMTTRLALVDLGTGDLRVVTHGPNSDSAPKWSPDGKTIAFLSDREQVYLRRLCLMDPVTGEDLATVAVPGFVEYLH